MIKIRKGSQILTVPKSSFKEFYQMNGWVQLVKKSEVSPYEAKVRSANVNELREMAKEKGIDTTGASKRTLIDELLKSKSENKE